MMIDAPAIAGPAALLAEPEARPPEAGAAPSRWPTLAADLRFFLTCYLAGLIVFLVMLS